MRPTSRSRTGTRCTPGTRVPALELTTIRADRLRVPDPDRLTHLVFRRFAACPICNVHLHSVARRHSEIVAAGVREIVVFHSSVDAMVPRSEEHTSELQSRENLVCRLLLEKKKSKSQT